MTIMMMTNDTSNDDDGDDDNSLVYVSLSKQSSRDRPGVLAACAKVEEARSSSFQSAGLIASQAPHSGDWLLTLPILACGL